jgi:hypothetical protein
MSIRRWLRNLQSACRPGTTAGNGRSAARSRPAACCRPRLEPLENRTLPSTFTVLNLADSGTGSLRQAVHDANANPGADAIAFAHGLHGTIGLTSGQLSITDALSITGPGATQLTISGSNASRVFDIGAGTTVTIADLTIANGATVGDGATVGSLGGGGILNEAGATLTLRDAALTNNTATAASNTVDVFGGGLLNEGTAIVASSTFSGNRALGGGGSSFFGGSSGGAIDNFGGATLTVTDSTFASNQALGTGAGSFGNGGAIENNAGFANSTPSMATITDSVFTGNLAGGAGATGLGGALCNEGTGTTMKVSSSLLAGNQSGGSDSATGDGGAIDNFLGKLTLDRSAVTDNQAIAGSSNTFQAFGGGLVNQGAVPASSPPPSAATRPWGAAASAASAAPSTTSATSAAPRRRC